MKKFIEWLIKKYEEPLRKGGNMKKLIEWLKAKYSFRISCTSDKDEVKRLLEFAIKKYLPGFHLHANPSRKEATNGTPNASIDTSCRGPE